MIGRDDIEPPSDDLRALLASERDISPVERAAIRDKLAVSIATSPPASAAIATTKLVWIAAAAVAVAASIWWLARDPAPAHVPVPTPQVAPPTPAPEPTITATTPEPPPPAPPLPASISDDDRTALRARKPSQAELLAEAWQALPADPARALKLVELDARMHASGALAEEREALRVQALAALDRRDDARARATEFLAQYPKSVHRKRVEAVLQ